MNKEVEFNLTGNFLSKSNSTIGIKEYELSDHLGNVSVVVLDRKECSISVIKPIVKTYTDYYPFGYPISSRTDNVDYRYGFNGQEGDDEIYGDAKSYTAEYWQYDSRLGRRWNVDPVIKFGESSYATFANNPINFRDFLGADTIFEDDIARQGFIQEYTKVLSEIERLENNIISNKLTLIFDEGLSKKEIKKIKKEMESDEDDLYEWKKLEADYNDILNSKVLVHYNSKTDKLKSYEMGMVSGGTIYSDGDEMTGDIYVSIRPTYNDYFIHENRHVCQSLQHTDNRKLLEKERESYMYQGVINPERIIKLIENAKKEKYPSVNDQPFDYNLDDAIKYIYRDLIEQEENGTQNH